MENTSYKLLLNSTINGVNAQIKKIIWIQGDDSCLTVPCYKENEYVIIELKPDCVGPGCIEGYVVFEDECTNCLPLPFKKCFCKVKGDCESCHDCSPDGECVSKCKPGEFCDGNDNCVECDPNNPCPGGQICKLGKCICPKGTFWNGVKCVQCDSTTILSKCEECINGEIKPKICDGACNPATGECVDCITNTQCASNTDGRNCCNANLECDCCPGFIWDATKQKCIVNPCPPEQGGPCKQCTDDGWVPVICPPFYKCDPTLDECVFNPCNDTPCDNGSDCGEDCGCKDKVCVECAKLSCEECAKALGCTCNPITGVCEKKTACDDEPCVTKYDCSEDCGCDQSECKDCANYSCEECGKIPGCKCVNGKCIGDGDRGCKDTFTLTPNKCDASLTAKLTKTQPCACETITSKVVIEAGLSNVIKLSIRKGFGDFNALLPLLDPTALNNSETEDQLTSLDVKLTLTALDINGNQVKAPNSVIKSYTSINENTQLGSINVSGLTPVQIGKIAKVKLTVSIVNLKFRDNKCSYEDKILFEDLFNPSFTATTVTFKSDDLAEQVVKYGELSSSDYRDPLFIWYRSRNSSFGAENIIRKQYIPFANGSYTDKLTLTNGFLPKFDYRLETDCTCADPVTLEDVVICEDINLPIELTQCNTRLEFKEGITLCDLSNTDLNTYKGAGIIKPTKQEDIDYANVIYELLVNGTKVTEFKASPDKVLRRTTGLKESVQGYIYTSDVNITSVALVVKVDGVVKCKAEKVYDTDNVKLPTYKVNCGLNSTVSDVIFTPVGGSSIAYITVDTTDWSPVNGIHKVPVPVDDTYTFTIHFASGCKKDMDVVVSCCDSKSVEVLNASNISINQISLVKDEAVTFNLNIKGFSTNAVITTDFGTIDLNRDLYLSLNEVASITTSRTIKVTVKENDCEKTVSLLINKLLVNLTVSLNSCSEGTLRVEGEPNATFTLSGIAAPSTRFLDSNGILEISTNNQTASGEVTYTLTSYKNISTNISVKYERLKSPTVTSITFDGNLGTATECTSNDIIVKVNGLNLDVNSILTYRLGFSGDPAGIPVQLELVGSQYQFKIPKPNVDTISLIVKSISNGPSCTTEYTTLEYPLNIRIPSNISVTQVTCNVTNPNPYIAKLSLPSDFGSGDSVVFVPPLTLPVLYDSSQTSIYGISGDSSFVAKVIVGGKERCPVTLNVVTAPCNCTPRNSTYTSGAYCKTFLNTFNQFDFTNSLSTDITIPGLAGLTLNDNPSSEIKIYLAKGLTPADETRINVSTNVTSNPGLNKVSINSMTGIPAANVGNSLQIVVRVAAKNNTCSEELRIPITVYQLSDIVNSGINLDMYYGSASTPFYSGSLAGLTSGTVIAATIQTNSVEVVLTHSGPTLPDGTIITLTPAGVGYVLDGTAVPIQFTKAELIAGTRKSFLPATGNSNNVNIYITKKLSQTSCIADVTQFTLANNPGQTVTVVRGITPVVLPQEICQLTGPVTFSTDFAGPEVVVSTSWAIDTVTNIVSTSSITSDFILDPDVYVGYTSNTPLYVFLTLNNGETRTGGVLFFVKSTVTPTFSPAFPSGNIVPFNYLGGTYTLPTGSVSGAWHLNTAGGAVITTLDTSTAGTKTAVYVPTGGKCAQNVEYILTVNAEVVVSSPVITGITTVNDCGETIINITTVNADQIKYSYNSAIASCGSLPSSSLAIVSNTASLTVTDSGTYYFAAIDTGTPGVCHIQNKVVTVTVPTNTTPSTALPMSFHLGATYTLPNPVVTSTGSVSGVWKDGAMSTVTAVDTSNVGPTTYIFIPDTALCRNSYGYNPNITCPPFTPTITNKDDVCATTLNITSLAPYIVSYSVNGGVSYTVGNTISTAGFALGSSTNIIVKAEISGQPCSFTIPYTYNKCAYTCTGSLCQCNLTCAQASTIKYNTSTLLGTSPISLALSDTSISKVFDRSIGKYSLYFNVDHYSECGIINSTTSPALHLFSIYYIFAVPVNGTVAINGVDYTRGSTETEVDFIARVPGLVAPLFSGNNRFGVDFDIVTSVVPGNLSYYGGKTLSIDFQKTLFADLYGGCRVKTDVFYNNPSYVGANSFTTVATFESDMDTLVAGLSLSNLYAQHTLNNCNSCNQV